MLQQHTLPVDKQYSHFSPQLSLLRQIPQGMYHYVLSSCNMHELGGEMGLRCIGA